MKNPLKSQKKGIPKWMAHGITRKMQLKTPF